MIHTSGRYESWIRDRVPIELRCDWMVTNSPNFDIYPLICGAPATHWYEGIGTLVFLCPECAAMHMKNGFDYVKSINDPTFGKHLAGSTSGGEIAGGSYHQNPGEIPHD